MKRILGITLYSVKGFEKYIFTREPIPIDAIKTTGLERMMLAFLLPRRHWVTPWGSTTIGPVLSQTDRMSSLPVPADRHEPIAKALELIRKGESIRAIAVQLGIPKSTLHRWLLDPTIPEEYREVQKDGMLQRVVDADQELEDAASPAEITKRAHICKNVRWDIERRLQGFQTKTEVTGANGSPLIPDTTELARRLAYLNASLARKEPIDVVPITPERQQDSAQARNASANGTGNNAAAE